MRRYNQNRFLKLTFLRLVLALVLPFILALALLATTTAPLAHENHSSGLKKVSFLLQWQHQFQFAGFYAAKEQGFYKQVGLDVEFIEYNLQHDRIKEVIEGRATFSSADASIIKERLQGMPVVLLSNYFKQSPFAIVARQKIRLPSDMKGKRLMVASSDFDNTSFKSMFKQFGINKEDMTLIPHSFNVQDFISGQVDAMSIYTTDQIFQLEQLGAPYSLIDPNNYGVSSAMNLFTSEDYAKTNPDTVRAFKQATDLGWAYALENSDEIIDLILRKYNTQNKSRAAYTFEVRETTKLMLPKVYPIGSIDVEQIKRIGEAFVQTEEAKSLDRLEGIIFDVDTDARKRSNIIKNQMSLTEEEHAYLKAHPIIRIGSQQDAPPFAFSIGGQPQGFSVDLLNLLASHIGFKPEYVTSPTRSQLLQMQREGKLDLLHSLGRTPEQEKSGHYSESYLHMKTVFVVRKNKSDITNFNQLNNSIMAVGKGSVQEDFLKRSYPRIMRQPLDSTEQMLEAISKGEAQSMIENDAVVSYWLHRKGILDLKISSWAKAFDKGRAQSLHFYARQDAPQLISILNKALATLPPSELAQLQGKWFGGSADTSLNKRIFLTPLQQDYLTRKKTINMCTDPDWMPVERIMDGIHEGIAADMIAKVARQLGTSIVLVPTKSWQESLDFFKARRCDILSATANTPMRRKTMDFTSPYISFPNVVITNNKETYFPDIESVLSKRFGVVKGYSLTEQLKTRYPGILLEEVANIRDGLEMVREGKLFGFIDPLPTASYIIQTQGLFDLKVAMQLPDKWELSIAARNDQPLLREILQAAITAVPQEERLAVAQYWTAVRFESVTDYALLLKILGVVILVVGTVAFSNRRLTKLNRALGIAQKEAQQSEHEIKMAHQTLVSTLDDLRTTQTQLINAEKRASLGQLVANVAHELNSPFGAVKSSGQMIAASLDDTIHQFPKLILMLNTSERELFIRLVSHRNAGILTSRERRNVIIALTEKLKHADIAQAHVKAETLVSLLAHNEYEEYLPLLRHPDCDIILKTAAGIGNINNGASIIGNAVDRASKIVTTLNSFAHTDTADTMHETDLREGIESILGIYRNQIMQNTELVCEFEKTDPFNGQPQELNQIWTHLIHNALQAMDYKGRLTVSLKQTMNEAMVSITDTGHGIPDEIKDRIFEPFFTTRPLGEGGGLGLSIAQKIVTKYNGRIEVQTAPGAGATFSVYLPLSKKTAEAA